MFSGSQHSYGSRKRGFTLVELLVVIGIMLLLTSITVMSINFGFARDRVRAAGRQIQSFISGARDRAIHAKEVRGVRLLLHPNNSHIAVGLQYIGAPDRLSQGTILFPGTTGDRVTIPNAILLQRAGLLGVGSQIEIPKDSGDYFVIASRAAIIGGGPDGVVTLNRPTTTFPGPASGVSYSLTLKPTIVPGSEPVQLPPGVAIDLDGSKVPGSWRPSSNNSLQSYSRSMDILFSPRGNVLGDAASVGSLHLAIADIGDIAQWGNIPGRVLKVAPTGTEWNPPVLPANLASSQPIVKNDVVVVSLSGRSGNAGVYPVNVTDIAPTNSIADDPFSYAETGEVSKQ